MANDNDCKQTTDDKYNNQYGQWKKTTLTPRNRSIERSCGQRTADKACVRTLARGAHFRGFAEKPNFQAKQAVAKSSKMPFAACNKCFFQIRDVSPKFDFGRMHHQLSLSIFRAQTRCQLFYFFPLYQRLSCLVDAVCRRKTHQEPCCPHLIKERIQFQQEVASVGRPHFSFNESLESSLDFGA